MNEPDKFVIETKGLSKSFGGVHALQGVDLKIPRHSIFGFLGPNGAGKTTLMKILLGLIRPTAGAGAIFGNDIVAESVAITADWLEEYNAIRPHAALGGLPPYQYASLQA